MTPNVVISNMVPGTGSTLFACDVRVELADGLTLVIRDARLLEASSGGGRFVGFPRRQRHSGFVKAVDFEGEHAAEIVAAIRDAMKRQLATTKELAEEVLDESPF